MWWPFKKKQQPQVTAIRPRTKYVPEEDYDDDLSIGMAVGEAVSNDESPSPERN